MPLFTCEHCASPSRRKICWAVAHPSAQAAAIPSFLLAGHPRLPPSARFNRFMDKVTALDSEQKTVRRTAIEQAAQGLEKASEKLK